MATDTCRLQVQTENELGSAVDQFILDVVITSSVELSVGIERWCFWFSLVQNSKRHDDIDKNETEHIHKIQAGTNQNKSCVSRTLYLSFSNTAQRNTTKCHKKTRAMTSFLVARLPSRKRERTRTRRTRFVITILWLLPQSHYRCRHPDWRSTSSSHRRRFPPILSASFQQNSKSNRACLFQPIGGTQSEQYRWRWESKTETRIRFGTTSQVWIFRTNTKTIKLTRQSIVDYTTSGPFQCLFGEEYLNWQSCWGLPNNTLIDTTWNPSETYWKDFRDWKVLLSFPSSTLVTRSARYFATQIVFLLYDDWESFNICYKANWDIW